MGKAEERPGVREVCLQVRGRGRSWCGWSWGQGEDRLWSRCYQAGWPCEDFGCSLGAVRAPGSLSTGRLQLDSGVMSGSQPQHY